MTSNALEVRRGFDLTRAPAEQWNEEMLRMVSTQLFRGRSVTKGELYYCMSVAEGLALNPLIGEIYFIPAKGKDGQGPSLQPYIGRNGLVARASERGYYYESDTVCENDRFRITRKADGTVTCTHSYTQQDRGEIVAAYAFLHRRDGTEKPAFFYATIAQYLPTFDQEWKMAKSSWGTTRSAMIEKCAMIGAGRKRLKLGNLLIDGEIPMYEQQGSLGPAPDEPAEFDWSSLGEPEAYGRLRAAVERVNELAPLSWPPAKLEMLAVGMDAEQLDGLAARVEGEADLIAERLQGGPGKASGASAGDSSSEPDGPGEAVTDAQVVSDAEHADALRKREADLEDRLSGAAPDSLEFSELSAELDRVQSELAAVENPDQESLLDGDGDG